MNDAAPKPNRHRPRPLSPHIQIYRWQMTMTMSILHRASGIALVAGMLVVVWMLAAGAAGPQAWERFQAVVASPIGKLMLFGWSVALYYHLFNGIRHLGWDMGYLYRIGNAYRAGYAVWAATAIFTLLTWWAALS